MSRNSHGDWYHHAVAAAVVIATNIGLWFFARWF
jgi:hypothetical protein